MENILSSNAIDFEKYFSYRKRLQHECMVKGDAGLPGTNIPAYLRTEDTASWGDGTIYLGWYIASLAMEYHLVEKGVYQHNGFTLETIKEDLIDAIETINRLDEVAEESFGCETKRTRLESDAFNGFFIRDDVSKFPGKKLISSDYTSSDPLAKEVSFDQIHHLLLGLALTSRFVSDLEIFRLVCDITERIVGWPAKRFLWRLHNPACNDKIVKRGPNGFLFEDLLNKACIAISDKTVDFSDRVCFLTKIITWLARFDNVFYRHDTTLHMTLVLASIGNNVWGDKTGKYIKKLCRRFDWFIYPLIYACLHLDENERIEYVEDILPNVDNMLQAAPKEGTSYDNSTAGWRGSHRFLYNFIKQNGGQDYYNGQQYSGVDFMLLFNLRCACL